MPRKQVRYAVVGLGHIAQVAVLPAFGNARRNSRLGALVSGDPVKLEELGAKYHVDPRYSYERYDEMLKSGEVDAVYIATPNSLHAEYAIRAAQAGLHVLVEKPMAVTEEQCERMAEAARTAGVKLMVAYRLHFERANLEAIEVARSGRIGEPRIFTSTFTMQVEPGNIRLQHALGGGTLYDIGIYCINAARGVDAVDADVVEGAAAEGVLQPDVARLHLHGEGRGEDARLADAPGARHLDRLEVGALEVQAIGHHQLDAGGARGLGPALALLLGHRHRLLDQHVQARLRRADRVLGMQAVRRGDVDRVDLAALQHLVVALVRVARVDVVLGAELLELDRVARDQRHSYE